MHQDDAVLHVLVGVNLGVVTVERNTDGEGTGNPQEMLIYGD